MNGIYIQRVENTFDVFKGGDRSGQTKPDGLITLESENMQVFFIWDIFLIVRYE